MRFSFFDVFLIVFLTIPCSAQSSYSNPFSSVASTTGIAATAAATNPSQSHNNPGIIAGPIVGVVVVLVVVLVFFIVHTRHSSQLANQTVIIFTLPTCFLLMVVSRDKQPPAPGASPGSGHDFTFIPPIPAMLAAKELGSTQVIFILRLTPLLHRQLMK
jgi:glucan phosphoethanolaminetransferase (alkaline phosphatase superfamily)